MLNLRKVAITGGIATGKSTVCHIFQKLGAYVISADQIVHRLYSQNSDLIKTVVHLLGNEIIVQGKIDRAAVANIVFESKEKLKQLEQLVHPVVHDEIKKQYEKIKDEGKFPLFVVEHPLLFELQEGSFYDWTLVVISKQSLACERYMQRTSSTKEEFERRYKIQMNVEEKAKKANFVIINNGSLQELEAQVKALFIQLV